MRACKHLDYTEGRYGPDIALKEMPMQDDNGQAVRYWLRGPTWTDNGTETPNQAKCQFCGLGSGRINGVFQCYNAGEMPCYEPSAAGERGGG